VNLAALETNALSKTRPGRQGDDISSADTTIHSQQKSHKREIIGSLFGPFFC
jgi:hypothetical protein